MKALARIHYLFAVAPFFLTPILSRRERGQPLCVLRNADDIRAESSRGFARRLGTFLPLPAGEGRGEGEPHFRLPMFDKIRVP